ncbi:MAG: amidase [bacterium]
MSGGKLLEVRALHGGYGNVPILRDISFEVGEGEVVGLLGHNGMGKTTLLKHLMGYLPSSSGVIAFDGEDITNLPAHRRSWLGLGYVPQGREIFPQLTVRDNLRFALHSDADEEHAIHRILRSFPRIEPLLERKGDYLSGGEKQLLAIARCLMADPVMLLLDEPTEGIQPSIINEIGDLLRRRREDNGLSILLVEQNFDFLAGLADRLLVLERGEIRAEVTAAEARSPDFLAKFIGLGETRPGLPDTPSPNQPNSPAPSTTCQNTHSPGNTMTIKRPDLAQMKHMAQSLSMSADEAELADYQRIMEPYVQAYDLLNTLPDNLPPVKYPRVGGVRPSPQENQMNAWYVKCEVGGAASGALAGKRIALKDSVSLAGVPMMNGASVMEGYVPDLDATIVTRMLDAGGTIVGKATCEYLCLSGGSHTSATGAVHNPWKNGYSAGGSSSGSGALVAAGEVDMAIGGDQGGSIRIPSSNCGCYGMKPTHGLVPYTGVFPIEMTIDTVGPITANVADNALLLEVLAGADGLDPRQYSPPTEKYTAALGQSLHGVRIGLLREGFGRAESEADVDAAVRRAADKLHEMGATVNEVSLPSHLLAPACWTAIAVEGLQDLMMHGNTAGSNYRGLYQTGLVDYFANWRARADELSASLKICMYLGEYFQTYHRGRFYAKAQNLSRQFRAEYDRMFADCDLLLMPTLPMKAQPLPPPDAPMDLYIQRAFEMIGNTCVFNLLGNPAMNIPCGLSQGLPIGMMLVAAHYREATIYRAAHAFEQSTDWQSL